MVRTLACAEETIENNETKEIREIERLKRVLTIRDSSERGNKGLTG
jgi:hypothetical protein